MEIQIKKKTHATYEGLANLHFFDDVNPEGTYREGWKALEHAVFSQISLDGLRPLNSTLKRHEFEGVKGFSVVIVVRVEATNG